MRLIRGTSLLALALVTVVLVSLAGCGQEGKTSLGYDFKAGDRFTYDMTAILNGNVSGPAVPADKGKIPADTTVKSRMELSVKEVTGEGVATVVYRHLSLSVTQDGKPVDTRKQELPEITVKIDRQGKVLSVEGIEKMLPGFSAAGLPFDPSALGIQSSVVFPEDSVAEPGDEWSQTTKVPIPGTGQAVTGTVKGKLVSVESVDGRQLATIDSTVDVPVDLSLDIAAILKETGLEAMLGQMGADLDDFAFTIAVRGAQSGEGTTTIDTKTGMPVKLSADTAIDMDLELKDAPASVPEGLIGPMAVDLKATVTLTEVK